MAEDPELERRLEAMFASVRPRPEFDDQLWLRLGAQRTWPRRLLGWLSAPAHLAPALAALVVVAGLGWLLTGFHPAGSGTPSATSAGASLATAPSFGVLPSLSPAVRGADSSISPALPTVPGVGAPALGIAGPAPKGQAPAELPVYRYDEPSGSALAAAVTALAGRSGLKVQAAPNDPAGGRTPGFQVTGLTLPTGPSGLAAAAQAFLGAHNLIPQYPYQVLVGSDRVIYNRQFDTSSGPVSEVTASGAPAGLEIDFSGGQLVSVSGPLELALASAPYPTRSLSAASPDARLVYTVVVSGGHGYYEPESLAAASPGAGLQPVIAPQWLAP
ncbi:MAG TPA: hypothetical protein VNG93_04110 [Candidatus Dormibacteraeota bacterium]|nr:hypothetical protein [Candidatus Dormibacteraeota bacterium]